MLILGRRPGESIVIAGGIRVVVISCDKRGVRLGIDAPASVAIARGELVTQSVGENHHSLAAVGGEWLPAPPAPRVSAEHASPDASAPPTTNGLPPAPPASAPDEP